MESGLETGSRREFRTKDLRRLPIRILMVVDCQRKKGGEERKEYHVLFTSSSNLARLSKFSRLSDAVIAFSSPTGVIESYLAEY